MRRIAAVWPLLSFAGFCYSKIINWKEKKIDSDELYKMKFTVH